MERGRKPNSWPRSTDVGFKGSFIIDDPLLLLLPVIISNPVSKESRSLSDIIGRCGIFSGCCHFFGDTLLQKDLGCGMGGILRRSVSWFCGWGWWCPIGCPMLFCGGGGGNGGGGIVGETCNCSCKCCMSSICCTVAAPTACKCSPSLTRN